MPPEKKSMYEKITPYIKDIIYLIGIGVATYGWISAKSESKAILETTVKYNTEEIKKIQDYIQKDTEFKEKQLEFNGIMSEFKNNHRQ